MKKLLNTILLVSLMGILCGCSVKLNTSIPSEDTEEVYDEEVETDVPEDVLEDSDTVQTTEEPDDMYVKVDTVEFENVTFPVFKDWEFGGNSGDTILYKNKDVTQSVSMFVQRETMYSSEEMQDACKSVIEGTFGDDCVFSKEIYGDYEWYVYSYDGVPAGAGDASVESCVFSNGDTTVYVEMSELEGTNGYFKESFLSEVVINTSSAVEASESESTYTASEAEGEIFTIGNFTFKKPENWSVYTEGLNQVSYENGTEKGVFAFQYQGGLGQDDLSVVIEAIRNSSKETLGDCILEFDTRFGEYDWTVFKYNEVEKGVQLHGYAHATGDEFVFIIASAETDEEMEILKNCLRTMQVN